jgi:hypothetical protein
MTTTEPGLRVLMKVAVLMEVAVLMKVAAARM